MKQYITTAVIVAILLTNTYLLFVIKKHVELEDRAIGEIAKVFIALGQKAQQNP